LNQELEELELKPKIFILHIINLDFVTSIIAQIHKVSVKIINAKISIFSIIQFFNIVLAKLAFNVIYVFIVIFLSLQLQNNPVRHL
jgi:hypothetical protein